MEIDNSTAHTGTRSLKVVGISATGIASHSQIHHEQVPIENGKTYTIAFWAKVDGNEGQSRELRITVRTRTDPLAGFFARDLVLDSTDWKEYTVTFIANMLTVGDVWINLAVAQSDVDFWIDDFRFFEGMPSDEVVEPAEVIGDVDGDGEVDRDDAALVLEFATGLTTPNEDQRQVADVDGDGRIRSNDALAILREIAETAAPHMEVTGKMPASNTAPSRRSALLQNFPNPFNPDTWIPYQLSEDAQVIIQIFSVRGDLVRELDLGYRPAGLYVSRDRAAHWDGRNELGETVTSGVYFYCIRAGGFTATRKLIVLK